MKHISVYAVAMLLFCCLVGTSAHGQSRMDRTIDAGWKFTRDNPAGAELPSTSEKDWEDVSLPHTWNARDGQDGGNDYYRGTGWYRKRLKLDAKFSGKSIFLKFDGSSMATRVYVNGAEAGSHRGSFGAFCFDVTRLVKCGLENLIAVKVNNAKDSTIAPLRGDFTIFGGIYRSVHLLVLEPLSISPLDYASSGVYVRQDSVSPDLARLEVTTVIRNGSDVAKKATIRCEMRDAGRKLVNHADTEIIVPPHSQQNETQKLSVISPHLWNGRKDPYLYEVSVSVIEKNRVLDRVSQDVGLRFFDIDPEKGLSLNGTYLRLNGVNRHQDRENKGWAIGMKEHREDYALIEEIGATAVRLAHYQQAQEFYDLCDHGGMVVWAELSLVDEINPSPEFASLCKEQLTELIKQSYNHPSIFFWSIFNELMPESNRPLYENVVTSLNTCAKDLDPTRPTVMASRSRYDGNEPINRVTDLKGYNVYRGWYEGKPEAFAAFADSLHARNPEYRLCISEYGAGASPSQHEIPPQKPQTKGGWHPEEWQSLVHEVTWQAMERRPYLWGTFVWNMFDFASDGRTEGEFYGRNDKGLVSYDRKLRKDAFYWYKANWNPDPMIHIASKRFVPRPAGLTEVRIYTNCDSLTLAINGQSLGMKKCAGRSVVWNDVNLVVGKNQVEATGYRNDKTIKDSCVWTATRQDAADEMQEKKVTGN